MLFQVTNLVKKYGSVRVVNDVSFEVNHGEIVGLLGRNGAGKTTTFRMAIGMLRPDEGRVYLNAKDITKLPMYQRARYGIGYLSQESSVFQKLTVEENLLAILETLKLNKSKRVEMANNLLEEFGLTRLRKQIASTLSGGEMRRLEISRALITAPSLILLDEPFSGVDPIAVNEIQEIIRKLKKKDIGILLTDHNVRDTLAVTDRSYLIDEGKIVASGQPEEITRDPIARQKYFGEKFSL